jgi:hypothetical protein
MASTLDELKKHFGNSASSAGAAGSFPNNRPLNAAALSAHSATATHYDLRILGFNVRGERYCCTSVDVQKGTCSIKRAGDGKELAGVKCSLLCISPCSKMQPIGK